MDAMLSFAGSALFAGRDNIAEFIIAGAQHAITFVVLFSAFSIMLKFLPDVHVRWRDAALGALVATILFSIGKHFLALYLSHAGTASAFGAAGSLAVVMMWLFFSAAVFLLGAEAARRSVEVPDQHGAIRQVFRDDVNDVAFALQPAFHVQQARPQ